MARHSTLFSRKLHANRSPMTRKHIGLAAGLSSLGARGEATPSCRPSPRLSHNPGTDRRARRSRSFLHEKEQHISVHRSGLHGSPVIQLTAERNGADWILGVCDNGIGSDPQYAEQIFSLQAPARNHRVRGYRYRLGPPESEGPLRSLDRSICGPSPNRSSGTSRRWFNKAKGESSWEICPRFAETRSR